MPVSSSYCELGAVQGLCPQRRWDAQTTPNLDDVLGFIVNRAAELDLAMLDRSIVVPVLADASPVAYRWLASANAYGAAMDAEAAGFPGQGDQGETPRLAFLRRQWERMLGDLRSGDVALGDAPQVSAGGHTFRYRTRASAWFGAGQAQGVDQPPTRLTR